MPISNSEYVLMAAQAYYYYRGAGADGKPEGRSSQAQTLEMAGFSGWTQVNQYTEPLSGFSATTFEKDGQYVIAFRGTDDWREGFGDAEYNPTLAPGILGGNGIGSQTREAIKYVERILTDDENFTATVNNISFTGHSLGGALAGISSAYFDAPAVTFDPAPYTNEIRDIANRLSTIAHSIYYGFGIEGEAEDAALFDKYISQIDFNEPPEKDGAEYIQELTANITQHMEIFRVQGEILDLLQATAIIYLT